MLAGGAVSANRANTTTTVGNSSSTSRISTFTFTPRVGYFAVDNIAVGLGFNVTSGSFKGGAETKTVSSDFELFGRYYFYEGFFGELSGGVGNSKTELISGPVTITDKARLRKLSVGAGYAYMLNNTVALEPLLLYQAQGSRDSDSDNRSTTAGLLFRLGLQVYLSKK
jgi:hypothetical protein